MFRAMLLCAGILCLFAADAPAESGQPATVSSRTADVAASEEFSIRLPTNPATG